MKLPASLEKSAAKFDAMSVRERALVALATIAGVFMIWMLAVLDPITARQRALLSEMADIEESMRTNADTLEAANNPAAAAVEREQFLSAQLREVDAQLASESAGLIPPERMVEVIHDVLRKQHGVKLISLHNKSVTSLIQPLPESASARDVLDGQTEQIQTGESGPYMHPVELVVEGRYLDILAYLRALEALPWHFYWKQFELQSIDYPLNRVRIELGTLSMDKEWIGV